MTHNRSLLHPQIVKYPDMNQVPTCLPFKMSLYKVLTQSLSYIITVSAEERLRPKPPALVLSRKSSTSGSVLNASICNEMKRVVI